MAKGKKKNVKFIVIDIDELIKDIGNKINSGEIKLKNWELK
jgi:hypothetical protein